MAQLEEQVAEVLRKYLPSIQVDMLQAQLDEGKKAIDRVSKLEQGLAEANRENEDLKIKNASLTLQVDSFKKREDELTQRELKCKKIETNWEVEKMKIMLAAQQDINKTCISMLDTVFHSPVYQHEIMGGISTRNGGGYVQDLPFHQMVRERLEQHHTHVVQPGMSETSPEMTK